MAIDETRWGPRASFEWRLLAAVLVASLALMLLGIQWGLPNLESWNGDDVSPEKPLRVLDNWLWRHHKYPYLHWWLNLLLYLPWLAGLALAGLLDLGCLPRLEAECFDAPERDMTVFMVVSRLLSVAMGVGVVLLTRKLALALHGDRRAALLAAAIAAGSPALVFFAHTGNLDLPVLFWFTASAVAAVAVWQRGALSDYGAFALLAGCAITTKDAVLAAYVLPGLALLGVHVARVRRESGLRRGALLVRALGDRRLLVLVGLLVGLYVVVQNVVFNFSGFLEHWRSWTEGSPIYQEHRAREKSLAKLSIGALWSLEAVLGLPILGLCVAGALYCLVRGSRTGLLALPLISYVALAIVPAFVAPRLMLPLLPFLAVWGGVLGSRLLGSQGRLRAVWAAVLALALLHEYGTALHLDLRMLGDSRYEAEEWIAENVPLPTRFAGLAAQGFLPRVERMGYTVRWHALSDLKRGTLESDGAEWALVGEGAHPHADRAYLKALRAGELGYEVAFRAEGSRPLPRWLDTRLSPGAVSPVIWVLRRRTLPVGVSAGSVPETLATTRPVAEKPVRAASTRRYARASPASSIP